MTQWREGARAQCLGNGGAVVVRFRLMAASLPSRINGLGQRLSGSAGVSPAEPRLRAATPSS